MWKSPRSGNFQLELVLVADRWFSGWNWKCLDLVFCTKNQVTLKFFPLPLIWSFLSLFNFYPQLQFFKSSKRAHLDEIITLYDAALHQCLCFNKIFSPIFSALYKICVFHFFVKLQILVRIIFMISWDEKYKSSLLLSESVASSLQQFFNLFLSSTLNNDVQNEVWEWKR